MYIAENDPTIAIKVEVYGQPGRKLKSFFTEGLVQNQSAINGFCARVIGLEVGPFDRTIHTEDFPG